MNLDDKLKELGNEVPQANPSLEKKIYMKSTRKKTSRNPFFNKLTLSLGGFVLTALALIIGIVSFNQLETHRMNTSVHLLQKVNEPTKINDSLGYSAQFLDKLNQFSSQLAYYTVEEQGQSENTVMSPVSIFSALALATECSDGSSREQILNAMGMDYDILSLNYEILYRQINRTGLNDDSSIVKSNLSNSIWMDKNITFKDSCLQNLANHYYSYSHGIDLKQKKYASRYITDFISKKTDGFLKPEYHVSNETVFLLINTYYLKDVWQNTGKEIRLTDSKYDFINSNGTKVNTKLMMGKYRAGKAQETEEYSEFYTSTSHGYKVHFIVPKDGYTIDQVFSPKVIAAACQPEYQVMNEEKTEKYFTRALFPEFSAESQVSLEGVFNKLGITQIFNPQESNLSKLSDDKLYCNNLQQYAKLKVNRKGIEGGAVTFFEGALSPGPGEIKEIYYDFIVDRSFGYVITTSSGVNLFSGIIRHI